MALYSVRLECVEGSSDKFYLQCVRAGASRGTFVVETTYGRNGCAGTMMHSDPHRSLDAARGAVDAMVAKKQSKGYVLVSSGEAPVSDVADDEDAGGGAGSAPPAKKARVAEKAPAAKADKPASSKAEKAKADKPFSPMLAVRSPLWISRHACAGADLRAIHSAIRRARSTAARTWLAG